MATSYGQFCPLAKAMEVLDERWTMLVIRELTQGSRHFNELRRGVPRMSPTLLSKRLAMLVRAGVVQRWNDGGRVSYELTEAGWELEPIVQALGAWGVRWVPQLGDADLDPQLLLWDVHRNLDLAAMPPGRTVLHFDFPDCPRHVRRWWIVVTPDEVDVCDQDPGFEVTLTLRGSLRTLVAVWRGDMSWQQAMSSGGLELDGSSQARRAVTRWLKLSPLAGVPRPSPRADHAIAARPAVTNPALIMQSLHAPRPTPG